MESVRPASMDYSQLLDGAFLETYRALDDVVGDLDEPAELIEPMEIFEHTEPTQEQLLQANIELFGHTSAIPLQNRLRYLIGDHELARNSYRYTEADELALKLGITEEELFEIIADLDIPGDKLLTDEYGNISLAPGLDVVIAEELEWRKKYDALPELASALGMANALGMNHQHVGSILRSSGIQPKVAPIKNSALYGNYYPKQLAYRLRAGWMMFPPARNHRVLSEIVKEIGCGLHWAETRAASYTEPEPMRAPNGRIANHYPPELQQRLAEEFAQLVRPEPGLRSIARIALELGRDDEWVSNRVTMRDRRGKLRHKQGMELEMHDEETFQALRLQSERLREIPVQSTTEVSTLELIKPLRIGYVTAERLLRQLGIRSVIRISKHTRSEMHAYDTSARVPLLLAAMEEKEALIGQHQATIDQLSVTPKENLTAENRKLLGVARQQIAANRIFLNKMCEAYARLTAATEE